MSFRDPKDTPYVVALRIDTGEFEPHYWTNNEMSKKELRRTLKRFKKDADVVEVCQMPWWRLYNCAAEARTELKPM